MNMSSLEPSLKLAAEAVFAQHGLTAEQAVALFYQQVSQQRDLPFEPKQPNARTLAAMQELREGKGTKYASLSDVYAELDAEDDAPA